MAEICNVCGLPKDLCVCDVIAKEQQEVVVSVEKKRFGKLMTVISGIAQSGVDVQKLFKDLKAKLACGGTVTDKKDIELQGDHRKSMRAVLEKLGFSSSSIKIK